MELLYIILFLFVGLILGYTVAHFKNQGRINRLEERERNQSGLAEKASAAQKEAEERARSAENAQIEMRAENRNLNEKLAGQKEEMIELQKKFRDEFENLANKILEEKSQKFTEQNSEKLDQLLKPLGEKMIDFRKKVEETYDKEMRQQISLKEQIKYMSELNKNLTEEAKSLTRALQNDSKAQGRWGEVILQRILEKSGLTEGREYETQVGIKSGSGGQQYLDVVVSLPDNKRVIIDSKVSLKAYNDFIDAENEQEQKQALKLHINSIYGHVNNLNSKKYPDAFGDLSPDFVLMFIPIESAFSVALQHDTELYATAFDKNIIIVSPTTLLATLATIDNVWKREYQNKNAMEIAERGGKLYDKFVLFAESMQDVGNRIRQTQDSYDEALSRLSTGRGSVIRQVELLRKKGAKVSKKLPVELVERAQLTSANEEE